jgi:hypothetical protein
MITVKNFGKRIYGRFGNEMFQYSLAKILAQLHNCEFRLNPTSSFLNFFDQEKLSYKPYDVSCETNSYIEKDPFGFDANVFNLFNIDLMGFFQNLFYYNFYLDIIYNEFKPNNKILNNSYNYMKHKNQYSKNIEKNICMHVRRTDYTALQQMYGFLDINYYYDIINSVDYNHIFIISDDIKYVETEFYSLFGNRSNVTYVKELDMYHDFYIMYLSGINIIANSTFSWWASFLSDCNQSKTIFAPSQWISNRVPVNLYPTNWNTVDSTGHRWLRLFQ